MKEIETAANMILMETGSGEVISKPNNARTRLKYGINTREVNELFNSTDPVTLGENVCVYPTANENVFITFFTGVGDTLPKVAQNPAGDAIDYLSDLETYINTGDVETLENTLQSYLSIPYSTVSEAIINKWFEYNSEITVTNYGVDIKGSVFVFWSGLAIKQDSTTTTATKLITEFEPFIDYMYPAEIKKWSDEKHTLTTNDLYIIQRVTNLYDSLVRIGIGERQSFETKTIDLLGADHIDIN